MTASLLSVVIVLVVVINAIDAIKSAHIQVTENDVRDLSITQKLVSATELSSVHIRGFFLTKDADFLEKAKENRTVVDVLLKELMGLPESPKELEMLRQIEILIRKWQRGVERVSNEVPTSTRRLLAKYFQENLLPIGAELRTTLSQLLAQKELEVHAAQEQASRIASAARGLVIVIAGIAVLLAGLLAFLIMWPITRLYWKLETSLAEQERLTTKLKRANEDLEHFSSIASHDLQEPLRTIATFLSLLERRYKDSVDQETHEYIRFAIDGATRLKNLVAALLTHSRMGNQPLKPEKVSCDELANMILSNLRLSIDESRATVTLEHLPTVTADPGQLSQVFQNLITNAIKYRSDAPPRIEISARPHGTDWLFAVRDNGIGFDSSNANQIFEAFKRLHTREKYPGTGLGLAVCKKIVERHGGHIWADSRPGEGSIFYFTLPKEQALDQINLAG
ncbi:MAG: hypothetical protein HY537_15985 [Deltaproteobacteria bacterium]|nr:hypothetical protein [Deltaproteobacteria bacterium]